MADSLIDDPRVAHAVSNITPRSERVPEVAVLQKTYVETGVLPQVNNYANQILYGRRGTGKTHVLQVLSSQMESQHGTYTIYVDMRLLGSAHVYTDLSRSLSDRCVAVFKDLLSFVQSRLLDIATDPEGDGSGIEEASRFSEAVVKKTAEINAREVRDTHLEATEKGREARVAASEAGVQAGISARGTRSSSSSQEVSYRETFRDSVVYAEVHELLNGALEAMGIKHLVLLIDEWTSLPPDMQPFIAEFLKRSLFPSPRVTVKIASLEYRSKFTLPAIAGNPVGFELGADISANLDLDDYYVYERNPDKVERIFQELLFKHVASGVSDEVFSAHSIRDANSFRSKLFTERATFVELVRAGEGVVRDFLGIFSAAYFKAHSAGRSKIDVHSVEEAARDWYETDKSTALSDEQQTALHRIINDVIGARQTKMFMLKREQADHPMIQSLFDLRLLHLISRGYSDKENPGQRYNIYALDYGTYVDLKRTKSEPQDFLPIEGYGAEFVDTVERIVPLADRRSIRRVILQTEIFQDLMPDHAYEENSSSTG